MGHHWIFVSTPYSEFNSGAIRGIIKASKQPTKWAIGRRTVHRNRIAVGDKVLFYQAGEVKGFVGMGEIASALQKHKEGFFDFLLVKDIVLWKRPVLVKDILCSLSFIKNKERWGAYFQGGVRMIGTYDYDSIIGKVKGKQCVRT